MASWWFEIPQNHTELRRCQIISGLTGNLSAKGSRQLMLMNRKTVHVGVFLDSIYTIVWPVAWDIDYTWFGQVTTIDYRWHILQCSVFWPPVCWLAVHSTTQYFGWLCCGSILSSVQFFFSFVSNSLLCYYHTLPYPKTKEKKIWTKEKIEPQQLQMSLFSFSALKHNSSNIKKC